MEEYSEFVETNFWEELIFRLATRDLIEKIGEIRYQNLAPKERLSKIIDGEQKYYNKFEKNGIINIKLVK